MNSQEMIETMNRLSESAKELVPCADANVHISVSELGFYASITGRFYGKREYLSSSFHATATDAVNAAVAKFYEKRAEAEELEEFRKRKSEQKAQAV